ncbi:transposon ty3-g Gag-Pol polyprotein [Plakobranchus ocellatus]|uniref:Transposon ty3-g Gag-Pol polyprotein n=1 Tax=Plakobranchus ocellatus TaxID=259542 RepID=A0AAV4CDZ9_9GAST|nr:transposon ty3-g Gag-Pol polyprotein [Plakobranchus ocellatus]
MTVQPNISAVSLKLPEFWTTSPEVWFARVEAQFGTQNISTDQTKYDYVVSALDVKTAEEVQDVLVNPPDANKYSVLKRALLKAFGKSQAQRDNKLLNLNGLGDRKPTALLRKINALNDDPQSLKRALFLSNLPADIRSILAGQDFSDIQKLAEAADRIWETRGLAPILAPLHAQASGKGQSIEWSAECQASFDEVKEILARSVLLHHPLPDAPTSLTVDASSTAVGAQLEQRQGQYWVPLAFFSRKLSDAEKKYSAFDRELLESYSAFKHFRHILEGRPFTLYTDHKPLTFALSSETDRSPRQTRHLAFISEFTTDIRHIKGKFNVVADALSRITTTYNAADTINLCPVSTSHPVEVDWTDFAQLAKDQIQSGEMASYRTATTGLILKDIDIGPSTLFCDTSLGVTRPVLPVSWTRPVFNKIHGLSHPGVRPNRRLSHNDSYGTV